MTFAVRTMRRDEVDLAVEWAAGEGWNPGLHDAEPFHAADPDGFLVGLLDGEPVATISAVRYADSFGFVGFYIVAPPHRGRGYGLRTWNEAIARLAGRNIGLDGVVDQQPNYRKSGFRLAYRNVRFCGTSGGDAADDADIVPLADVPLAALLRYDAPFFPAARGAFLRSWFEQPGHVGAAVVRDGGLAGYGVLRPCRSGCKIGPLFADDPRDAERLFGWLRARAPAGAPVFLDIPETNAEAVALVRRHGMSAAFETARMYTGEFPDLPITRLYGVTTFELG